MDNENILNAMLLSNPWKKIPRFTCKTLDRKLLHTQYYTDYILYVKTLLSITFSLTAFFSLIYAGQAVWVVDLKTRP